MSYPCGAIRAMLPVRLLCAVTLALAGVPVRVPAQVPESLAATADWRLSRPAPERITDRTHPAIQGYADSTSVPVGGSIDLKLSADPPATVELCTYRMGWYDGLGAELCDQRAVAVGTHPVPRPQPGTGLIECAWPTAATLSIPGVWRSGVYLTRLTRLDTGEQSYVPFVVTDPDRPTDLLVQCSVTTWQAYNPWGGKSLYDFNSRRGRAHKVSFDRPYYASGDAVAGVGAGEFLTVAHAPAFAAWEYPVVRWLERKGYDVSYCTNLDLEQQGARFLANKRVFVSMGHDEYWSDTMRGAVEAAQRRGVNLLFLGANACYFRIAMEVGQAALPDRVIACAKDPAIDPLQVEWRNQNPPRPENALIGTMYDQSPASEDFLVVNSRHWAFNGSGARDGMRLPNLVGYEIDRTFSGSLAFGRHCPQGLQVLCTAPALTTVCESALYVRNNALVFSTGSMQWAWGLDSYTTRNFGRPGWTALGEVNSATGVQFAGSATALANSDGRVLVLCTGRDGQVWFCRQYAANGGWSAWDTLARWTALPVSCQRTPSGSLDLQGRTVLTALGTDGSVWLTRSLASSLDSQVWGLTQALHLGSAAGQPVSAVDNQGALLVLARGADGRIQVAREITAGSFAPFVALPGVVGGDPAVARRRDGHVQMGVRGLDGTLLLATETGGGSFTPWTPAGITIAGTPELATQWDGTLALLVRTPAGVLQIAYEQQGQWSGFTPLAQGAFTDLATARDGTGRLHVFWGGLTVPDNQVFGVRQQFPGSPGFTPVRRLGVAAAPPAGPAAAAQTDGRVVLIQVAEPWGTAFRCSQKRLGGDFDDGNYEHPVAQRVTENVLSAMGASHP